MFWKILEKIRKLKRKKIKSSNKYLCSWSHECGDIFWFQIPPIVEREEPNSSEPKSILSGLLSSRAILLAPTAASLIHPTSGSRSRQSSMCEKDKMENWVPPPIPKPKRQPLIRRVSYRKWKFAIAFWWEITRLRSNSLPRPNSWLMIRYCQLWIICSANSTKIVANGTISIGLSIMLHHWFWMKRYMLK